MDAKSVYWKARFADKNSHWALHYILAYCYIQHEQEIHLQKWENIERLKKQFKMHCSAIILGEKLIYHCFQTTGSEQWGIQQQAVANKVSGAIKPKNIS